MRGHCVKDVGVKVAAFTSYLENNKDQQSNLTPESVELLTEFAKFMQKHKHGKDMYMGGHGHDHIDHKCGKFGKHGHHGMFGHHFGRHGPHGRRGHGHGHEHGHGHGHVYGHGHGHGHGNHGKHGFEFGMNVEHEMHTGKHHRQFCKHSCKMVDQTIVIEDDDSSPPLQENAAGTAVAKGQSDGNNGKCVCERKGRHCGRRWRHNEWTVRRTVENTEESALHPPEPNLATEVNDQPQEDLVTVVENITIEDAPQKE